MGKRTEARRSGRRLRSDPSFKFPFPLASVAPACADRDVLQALARRKHGPQGRKADSSPRPDKRRGVTYSCVENGRGDGRTRECVSRVGQGARAGRGENLNPGQAARMMVVTTLPMTGEWCRRVFCGGLHGGEGT